MKKIVKSREENADDSSPLSRLPDEIILQILNKLIDLKTLCFCYLVPRRFSSIVLQVDATSFTTPPLSPPTPDGNTFGDIAPSLSVLSRYASRFSLPVTDVIIVVYSSGRLSSRTLLGIIWLDFPLLKEVSITDSGRSGRLSLSGGKLAEVKQWLLSASEPLESEWRKVYWSECFIPVLELPVSGYVMKGITLLVMETLHLQGGDDSLMISKDGLEDEKEAAYTKALMEILEKHKSKIQRMM